MTSTGLGNQCLKTCSWIPPTRFKSLLLNSALLEIKIPAQLLIVHMQVHYWTNSESTNSSWNPLIFADSAYILRNPLTVAESRTTSYICLLRNPHQSKCADKINVAGICMRNPLNFVCGIHLHFGTYFKTCLWKPGTYRHKIVLLSSAQLSLIMKSRFYGARSPQKISISPLNLPLKT